jgi:hypothetical protein
MGRAQSKQSSKILGLFLCLALASCGTGGTNSSPATFTVGGAVSGLKGSGLVLQNNGGDNLAVSANGSSFAFTTALASGAAYSVTVLTQPTNPNQTCIVASGSGTLVGNISNVSVTCTTNAYTIGGTVINLLGTGGGLQLQDNGGDNLLVNANGTFTFPTALVSGSTYSVTVSVQPSALAQTCEVTHGAGTATANVTSVVVDCGHGDWTWMGGPNVVNQLGTYGTKGMAAAGNVPGAREGAISWTDAAGNFWLFGGYGYAGGALGFLNDLWEYSAGHWTWMGGSSAINQQGTYGTKGTAGAGNVPGGRYFAVAWTDATGNFWLFGGSAGALNYFNDLWEYSAGQWTWMGGSNVANQAGAYGAKGAAAASNFPGGREGAITWTDSTGNFWLFGGYGLDSTGQGNYLNDMWKYSAGQWAWMGGSNVIDQAGTYGTKGKAAAGSIPGAREGAITWIDATGNFWLFGGNGFDSTGTQGLLNDLWEYSAGQWTWMGGSNVIGQTGTYGTKGTAASGNVPGGRNFAAAWTDAAGNFWLFGGNGYVPTAVAAFPYETGYLNDLWKYSAGQWTWIGGPNIPVNGAQLGNYGTLGTAAPSSIPGGRQASTGWTDATRNFWLFSGNGYDSGAGGFLSDLWKYEP